MLRYRSGVALHNEVDRSLPHSTTRTERCIAMCVSPLFLCSSPELDELSESLNLTCIFNYPALSEEIMSSAQVSSVRR